MARPVAVPLRRPARPPDRRSTWSGPKDTVYSPDVLRRSPRTGTAASRSRTGSARSPQPVLVLAGRHDRTCTVEAAEAMAAGIPGAELRIFEHSGHMTFVEEQELYVAIVRSFLERTA